MDIQDIAGILKQEIRRYAARLDMVKVGRVLRVGDGIARIHGLPDALADEMLLFEADAIGEVFNLEEDFLGVVIYGDHTKVREGSEVRSTGRLMSVPVGDEMIGRIVTPLGQPLDGGPAITAKAIRLLESEAPGITQRQPVRQPLYTGLKSVDAMIPIGRGQRELIIGDRKTGKLGAGLVLKLTDRINEYKALSQETRLRHGTDPTDIPAPHGDRPYHPRDPDGGELSEDGHWDAAFDDSRRDSVAREPGGVV